MKKNPGRKARRFNARSARRIDGARRAAADRARQRAIAAKLR